MPAQQMFGNSDVNANGSRLPLVALRALAMQASISRYYVRRDATSDHVGILTMNDSDGTTTHEWAGGT